MFERTSTLDAILETAGARGIPGVVAIAADRDRVVYAGASGARRTQTGGCVPGSPAAEASEGNAMPGGLTGRHLGVRAAVTAPPGTIRRRPADPWARCA